VEKFVLSVRIQNINKDKDNILKYFKYIRVVVHMKKMQQKSKKDKKVSSLSNSFSQGYLHIYSTYSNILLTLTNANGATLTWVSAGRCGFKGTRKSTPFAAQTTGEHIAQYCRKHKIKQVDIFIRGFGHGREAAMRGLARRGINVRLIRELTCVPHNGCRAPQEQKG